QQGRIPIPALAGQCLDPVPMTRAQCRVLDRPDGGLVLAHPVRDGEGGQRLVLLRGQSQGHRHMIMVSLWYQFAGARRATNTHSRPGRSGASRTSRVSKPHRASEASTCSRERNRNVATEGIVTSSSTGRTTPRKVTSSPRTSSSSFQVSTRPVPGTSTEEKVCSLLHRSQA